MAHSSQRLLERLFIIGLFVFVITNTAFSQAIEITLDVKSYAGGYNVTCYGATNGVIDATIVNGTPPYTYQWSNGATTQDITSLAAGVYTLTVTDNNNHQATKTTTLIQSNQLQVSLSPKVYEGGYNISQQGGSDGSITTNVTGGTPPYTYLWSNGATTSSASNLSSGTFSVTVTDANACNASQSVTLYQPGQLIISSITSPLHHGYNVSCNGGSDGAVNITVSGGVSPYTYQWSNGEFTQNIQNAKAGISQVLVKDKVGATNTAQITLTEPDALSVELVSPFYPNGSNVSCYDCFNGSITTNVTGGVGGNTYEWFTGETTANLSNLGEGEYVMAVIDANDCKIGNSIYLKGTDRDDWTMAGNAEIDPATQFIGTIDQSPIAFRTNNTEAMRINEDGNVGIGETDPQKRLHVAGGIRSSELSFTTNTTGEIHLLGSTGLGDITKLQIVGLAPDLPVEPCVTPDLAWYHSTCQGANPNTIFKEPIDGYVGIGTDNPQAKLDIVSDENTATALLVKNSDGISLMQVKDDGIVQIGESPSSPGEKLTVNGNVFVNGTIMGKRSTGALFICGNTGSDNGGDIELYGPTHPDRPSWTVIVGKKILFDRYVNGSFLNSMSINENGQVGINWDFPNNKPTNTDYKLCVNGKIFTQGETIKLSQNWPDFVFHKDYDLISLKDLQKFIEKNGHLPNIPSAVTVKENGMDVEQINIALLQKVEELTLYILEMQKQIDELKPKGNEK